MLKRLKESLKRALAAAGAFLHTDMRYVARQGSWLLSGQFVANVMSFLLVIAFGNLLPKETYGVYKYVLSLAGIFMLTSLADMSTAVIRGVAQGYEGVYREAVRAEIKWGILGALGALAAAVYYFQHDNAVFAWAFVVVAAAVPFFDTANTYLYIFAGKKRFDLQAKYNMISRVVSGLCLIGTLLVTKNVVLILIAYYVPYIIIGFFIGPREFARMNLNGRTDPSVVAYGKHLSLIAAFSFAVNYLDNIIVFQFLGPAGLAVFSIAQAPVSRVQSLFAVIPEIALPKYASGDTAVLKSQGLGKMSRAMLITLPIVALAMAATPFFFRWFLPQYQDAIVICQILMTTLILYPFVLMNRILVMKADTRLIYWYNAIESVVQLAVMLLLVWQYGLMGAALGRVLVSVFGHLIAYRFFRHV